MTSTISDGASLGSCFPPTTPASFIASKLPTRTLSRGLCAPCTSRNMTGLWNKIVNSVRELKAKIGTPNGSVESSDSESPPVPSKHRLRRYGIQRHKAQVARSDPASIHSRTRYLRKKVIGHAKLEHKVRPYTANDVSDMLVSWLKRDLLQHPTDLALVEDIKRLVEEDCGRSHERICTTATMRRYLKPFDKLFFFKSLSRYVHLEVSGDRPGDARGNNDYVVGYSEQHKDLPHPNTIIWLWDRRDHDYLAKDRIVCSCTLLHSMLRTLLHELLHSFFTVYACACETCIQSYRQLRFNVDHGGHGPAYQRAHEALKRAWPLEKGTCKHNPLELPGFNMDLAVALLRRREFHAGFKAYLNAQGLALRDMSVDTHDLKAPGEEREDMTPTELLELEYYRLWYANECTARRLYKRRIDPNAHAALRLTPDVHAYHLHRTVARTEPKQRTLRLEFECGGRL